MNLHHLAELKCSELKGDILMCCQVTSSNVNVLYRMVTFLQISWCERSGCFDSKTPWQDKGVPGSPQMSLCINCGLTKQADRIQLENSASPSTNSKHFKMFPQIAADILAQFQINAILSSARNDEYNEKHTHNVYLNLFSVTASFFQVYTSPW